MVNKGIVQKSENGSLTVVFERPEACGECHACSRGSESCAKHTLVIRGEASPGDEIKVEIDDGHVVAASALAYLIPLAGMILGLLAGYAAGGRNAGRSNELLMAGCALAGTALGYLLMRRLNPVFSKDRWQPRIVSVTPKDKKKED